MKLPLLSTLLFALLSSPGFSATIMSDSFESVGATPGADANDPLDIAYFDRLNRTTFSVVTDSVLGGAGNQALRVDSTQSFNVHVGTLYNSGGDVPASVSLGSAAGDQLSFGFDFRIDGNISNNGSAFRFGLYNGSGTTSDNDSSSDSSTGYRIRFGTGSSSGISLNRELGVANEILLGSSSDFVNVINGSPSGVSINDNVAHSVSLLFTRRGDSGVDISVNLDGSEVATGTDSSGYVDSFNEVAFGNGNASNDYHFDNIRIETLPIPEPSSFALMAMAFSAGILALRRRKH